MKTYLEIIEKKTKSVVLRIDVSEKSENAIFRTEMGMNINLNHEEYYTNQVETENELPEIKQ